MKSKIPSPLKKLYAAALAARKKAYSPYSGHQVGAAVRLTNGKIFTGCNVENSSYGGTICAERVAIMKAVSENGKVRLAEVVVVTNASPPWPPCGLCRQVLAEFASGDDMPVHAANLKGEFKTMTFAEMLPDAFTPAYLGKK